MATANDDASNNLVIGPVRSTGFYTRSSPSVFIGYGNRIGIAWSDTTLSRQVNFAVSTDSGQTWTLKIFGQVGALGGVALTYSWWANKWVLAWLHQGCDTASECTDLGQPQPPKSHRITTLVSDNSLGLAWTQAKVDFGDAYSMPNLTPAITCARSGVNKCLMVFRSLNTFNIRSIYQQALEFAPSLTALQLVSGQAGMDTTNYGYSDLSIARINGGYVYSYTWPTIENDKLTYRIKLDANGESGAMTSPLQTFTGPLSRTGFSVAYNYRTGGVRFLWKEQ